jgi:hypothetical protein
MWLLIKIGYVALVVSSLSPAGVPSNATASATGFLQEPEWQTHAKWCTTDRGSSHAAYLNACQNGKDQFDSVLVCQGHSGGAQNAIRSAGRQTVNAFMDNWKSSECP